VSGTELSPVPKEARAYQGASAGIVTRFVANTIDAAVVAAMVGGCYLGWASVIFLLDPRSFSFPSASFLAFLTTGLALATLYLWLAWWLVGRSYGGHVMGIRVTGRRGRARLGPLRALGRAAFCVFFPIGLFWCLVSPKRHSLQDIAVFSSVVYDWMPRPAGQGAPLLGRPAAVASGAPSTSDAEAARATSTLGAAAATGAAGEATPHLSAGTMSPGGEPDPGPNVAPVPRHRHRWAVRADLSDPAER
jgi:hypothetical protein